MYTKFFNKGICHSSPQFLNLLNVLQGPLFGDNFARTNMSRMFLCLLYEMIEKLHSTMRLQEKNTKLLRLI